MQALDANDTYFVVFRYGAVVLFQGTPATTAPAHPGSSTPASLRTRARAVRPPSGAPHPQGPWDSGEQEWQMAKDAAWKAHDSQLISLLLRPFMRDVSINQDVRSVRVAAMICLLLCAMLLSHAAALICLHCAD